MQGKDASNRDELVATSRLRAGNSDKARSAEENRDPVYVSTPVVISTPGDEVQQPNTANTYNQTVALGNTSSLNAGTGGQAMALQSNTTRLLNDSSGTSANGTLLVVSQSQTGVTFNGGQFNQAATSQPAYNAYNDQTMVTGGTVVLNGATTDTLAKQKELPAPAKREVAKEREASVSLGSNNTQQDGSQLQLEGQRRAAEPQVQSLRITLNRRAHSDKPANVAASTVFYATTAPATRPADANLRQVPQASPAK